MTPGQAAPLAAAADRSAGTASRTAAAVPARIVADPATRPEGPGRGAVTSALPSVTVRRARRGNAVTIAPVDTAPRVRDAMTAQVGPGVTIARGPAALTTGGAAAVPETAASGSAGMTAAVALVVVTVHVLTARASVLSRTGVTTVGLLGERVARRGTARVIARAVGAGSSGPADGAIAPGAASLVKTVPVPGVRTREAGRTVRRRTVATGHVMTIVTRGRRGAMTAHKAAQAADRARTVATIAARARAGTSALPTVAEPVAGTTAVDAGRDGTTAPMGGDTVAVPAPVAGTTRRVSSGGRVRARPSRASTTT